MWFANNTPVENACLGYLAKYTKKHEVKLYAFALEGSHIQSPALFPKANRASFMRDVNSNIARAVKRLTPNYLGGGLFERRYSNEFVPGEADIEEYFFYTVLQPVKDHLVERISDYPFYNCFSDAVRGIERKVEVVNWTEYYAKRRYDQAVSVKDFIEVYTLKYERLPGYEHLSQADYSKQMHEKLEARRAKIVNARIAEGKGFLGRKALLTTVPGTRANNPKKSKRDSHRPRILSICPVRREIWKNWYFGNFFTYKKVSKAYREGDITVVFPEGMYPPHLPCKLSP